MRPGRLLNSCCIMKSTNTCARPSRGAFAVSIARIAEVPDLSKIAEYEAERDKMFGAYSATPKMLCDPEDAHQIAIVGDVWDLDGLRKASRTPRATHSCANTGSWNNFHIFWRIERCW